jgi:hypothetical protein
MEGLLAMSQFDLWCSFKYWILNNIPLKVGLFFFKKNGFYDYDLKIKNKRSENMAFDILFVTEFSPCINQNGGDKFIYLLLDKMRKDSASKKIGLWSLVNYWNRNDVNEFAKIDVRVGGGVGLNKIRARVFYVNRHLPVFIVKKLRRTGYIYYLPHDSAYMRESYVGKILPKQKDKETKLAMMSDRILINSPAELPYFKEISANKQCYLLNPLALLLKKKSISKNYSTKQLKPTLLIIGDYYHKPNLIMLKKIEETLKINRIEGINVLCIGKVSLEIANEYSKFNFIGHIDEAMKEMYFNDNSFMIFPNRDLVFLSMKLLDAIVHAVPFVAYDDIKKTINLPAHCLNELNFVKSEIEFNRELKAIFSDHMYRLELSNKIKNMLIKQSERDSNAYTLCEYS